MIASTPYSPGDEKGILALRRAVFGQIDPVRLLPEAWKWQFENNPAGKGFIRLAWNKGRVIGQYAAIPVRLLVDNRPVLAAFSCDTMIDPAYRGKGLFVQLANELYDDLAQAGIDLVWGFPNSSSMPGFTRRLGWKKICPLPFFGGFSSYFDLAGLFAKKIFRSNPAAFGPVGRFGPEHDALWKENAPKKGIVQVKDSAWCNWRYMDRYEFGYEALEIPGANGLPEAFFVLRRQFFRKIPVCVLVDFFPFSAASKKNGRLIALAAANIMKSPAIAAAFSPALWPAARKLGLFKAPGLVSPKKIHLAARFSPALSGPLANPSAWFCALSDTDLV
ncbi:MAG: GNAT family N-acetyltransferase [Desulfatibacillaceae bacterium]|nr:GNAT family N-acetyltransferase [Desulfatibacillaceae bacterium]